MHYKRFYYFLSEFIHLHIHAIFFFLSRLIMVVTTFKSYYYTVLGGSYENHLLKCLMSYSFLHKPSWNARVKTLKSIYLKMQKRARIWNHSFPNSIMLSKYELSQLEYKLFADSIFCDDNHNTILYNSLT